MDLIRDYKKNIVENKNIVFVSIVLSLLIRFLLFSFLPDTSSYYYSYKGSFLLEAILPEFVLDKTVSFLLSILFTFGIMFYAVYLNAKYALIRNRTYLVYVFIALVFSSHPAFVYMNTQYIALFLFLVCINVLFSSYQIENSSKKTYAVGFLLALSSLFSLFLLLYLILFWIGFILMRSLNFKSFITSILGVLTIYWLVFCYYLWQYSLLDFVNLFTQMDIEINYYIKLVSVHELISLGIALFFLFMGILNSQMHSFQDKIRIRATISFLEIVAVFSLVFCFFVNFDPVVNLYIFSFSYAMILSHFFTLADQKWKVYLFGICIFSTIISSLFYLLG